MKGYKEYIIKNPHNYKEDISMSGKDSILIQEYINNIKGNIPPHYEEIQYLNFRDLLSSLKLYKIYPTYRIPSKSTQGTYSATCLYKRALHEDIVFREPIEIKNATLPYIFVGTQLIRVAANS
jgi:hypothetical protein